MRKIGKILLVGLVVTMLAACGKASGEEIARVQGMYADLVEQHNEVVEVYAGVEDDSLGKELEEMAKKIEDIGLQDTQGMDDAKLDDVVEQMNGYAKEYERMMAELEAVKEQEGAGDAPHTTL